MSITLTARQAEVLDYIEHYVVHHGFPPSGREITTECRLGGASGAHRMILTLERKGFLTRSARSSRGIALVRPDAELNSLPTGDAVRLAAMAEVYLLAADLQLEVARRLRTASAKEMVIEDALGKMRRAGELNASLVRLVPNEIAISTYVGPVAAALKAVDACFPAAVVDLYVLNSAALDRMNALARPNAEVRAVLWPDIRLRGATHKVLEAVLRKEGITSLSPSRLPLYCERSAVQLTAISDMVRSITRSFGRGKLSPMSDASPDSDRRFAERTIMSMSSECVHFVPWA